VLTPKHPLNRVIITARRLSTARQPPIMARPLAGPYRLV
jgi:hypothetical protein